MHALGQADHSDDVVIEADRRSDRHAEHAVAEPADAPERRGELALDRAGERRRRRDGIDRVERGEALEGGEHRVERVLLLVRPAPTGTARRRAARRSATRAHAACARQPVAVIAGPEPVAQPATNAASSAAAWATLPGRTPATAPSGSSCVPRRRSRSRSAISRRSARAASPSRRRPTTPARREMRSHRSTARHDPPSCRIGTLARKAITSSRANVGVDHVDEAGQRPPGDGVGEPAERRTVVREAGGGRARRRRSAAYGSIAGIRIGDAVETHAVAGERQQPAGDRPQLVVDVRRADHLGAP